MKRKKRTTRGQVNKAKKITEHVRDSSKLNDADLNCKVCILMSQYIGVCRRNFTCFECGRAFRVPQKKSPAKMPSIKMKTSSNLKIKPEKILKTPPVSTKIKISAERGVDSPPEADTLDSTIHFGDLVTPQTSRKRKGDPFMAISTPTELSARNNSSLSPQATVTGVRQSSRQRKTKNTRKNDFVYDVPSSGRDDFYDHHCKQCESELIGDSKVQCTACSKFFCSICHPDNDSLSSINFTCSSCQNSSPKKISPKVEKTKRQKKKENGSIKLWNCPNDWCHYFIETHNRSESDQLRLMSRHSAKCKEKWLNEQKRLVHVPFGKKGAIYVPVSKYGLAFGDFKSEPVDEADHSIASIIPMAVDDNAMDSLESNWSSDKFMNTDSNDIPELISLTPTQTDSNQSDLPDLEEAKFEIISTEGADNPLKINFKKIKDDLNESQQSTEKPVFNNKYSPPSRKKERTKVEKQAGRKINPNDTFDMDYADQSLPTVATCPNDWCTYTINFPSANPLTVSKLKCSMRRHVNKCSTMYYTENKRLIHCPGQRPNRYVSIEEHGIALDNYICKTETE